MTNPGAAELPSVNPIREQLKTARNQLERDAGDIEPAKRAVIEVARTVSSSIESGKFSDDPDAYVLKAIKTGKNNMGKGTYVSYALSAHEESEKPQMHITLSSKGTVDMYYMGEHPYGVSPHSLDYLMGGSPSEVFSEFEDFYGKIEQHGIRINPDEFTSDVQNYQLGSFLDKFVYTKQLGERNNKFKNGLQSYAEEREKEQFDQTEPLKASLVKSIRSLLWKHSPDGVIPGQLLSEAEQEPLARLTSDENEYLDINPQRSLREIERELTKNFLTIEKDETTGKEILKIQPETYKPGRFEREGEFSSSNDEFGFTRKGHGMYRDEASGALLIKPDDDTTFTNLTVTLAPPDEELTADLLDKEGNPVVEDGLQKKITAKPILKAILTETVEGKEEPEKTSLYRTREGLVVRCPGGTAKCYPNGLSPQAYVTKKPVIYLYPKKTLQVHVKLDYKGRLTNTYPQINGNTWDIVAIQDGTLQVNGKYYKYLFWDGINSKIKWDWTEGFCVNRKDIDAFLETKSEKLGLNFAEAQDFITYWAPIMKQNRWSLVSFQTTRYEQLAKLFIDPQPDTLIRVFMTFKKCNKQISIKEQKLKPIKRKGFTVVEWGGSNLDELSMTVYENKSKNIHESHFELFL